MKKSRKSIVSQLANLQICGSKKVINFHPQLPTMYFKTIATNEGPEIKFNNTEYFYNDQDLSEFNQLSLEKLHEELCSMPEFGTSYGSPFRVMRTPDDPAVRPAYMPLIQDAEAYGHKSVPVFFKWFFMRECPHIPVYIPAELESIFDLKVIVDLDTVPVFGLPMSLRQAIFGANKVGVHVMEVKDSVSCIYFNVHAYVTYFSSTRYYSVGISSDASDVCSSHLKFQKGSVVVVWNARNAHRPSFREQFEKLHNRYKPMLVVMTEARCSKPWLYHVRNQMVGDYRIEAVGPSTGLGGVLVAWDRRVVPYFTRREDTLYGHVVSMHIKPSDAAVLLPRAIPATRYLPDDSGTDEDVYVTFTEWFYNSGVLALTRTA